MWYCVVLQEVTNMAKRRPLGEGMIRLKKKEQWEGSYSLKFQTANAKSSIFMPTQEKNAEERLAEMIKQKNAEIAAEKERLKSGRTA